MKRPTRSTQSQEETDLSQVNVQMRPILGVQPSAYLTVIYVVGAALVLFFLLVYPGLRSQGTYIAFVTRPVGAAIQVDGVYRGFTPAEVLVRRGRRVLTLSWPGMAPVTLEREVRGRVFATLLFKPRDRVVLDLDVPDPAALASQRLLTYATYAHERNSGILTQTARALTSPGIRDRTGAAAALADSLASSMAFLAPEGGDLADYIRAWSIHEAGGGVLGPAALAGLVRDLAVLASQRDYWLIWALLNSPNELAQHAAQQDWVRAEMSRIAGLRGVAAASPTALSAATVAGVTLRPVPGGTAVIGDDTTPAGSIAVELEAVHAVNIRPFLIAETEITNRQYAAFLAETEVWRKTNTVALMSEGLVSDQYLAEWTGVAPPAGREDHPVTHVSHAAARAYAVWLTGKLPPALQGYTVRLPYEAEWEWAARGGGSVPRDPPFRAVAGDDTVAAGSSGANGYGLREMMGNVWEWCQDWYAPAAYFLRSAEGARNPADTTTLIPLGAERVVRGGSWANEGRQVPVYARGGQPPAWTTPFLGFRVVAVRSSP